MAISRYELVRRLAAGRRVLEVACGSGQGLRYVGREAQWIVGGDVTRGLLGCAQRYYQGAIPLLQFDAHDLPFIDKSFDLVQIHEAVYYMARTSQVFQECKRVLRPGGILVVSSINPEWKDFNPSPFATAYYTAAELKVALSQTFPSVESLFGFPLSRPTMTELAVSVIKRAAVQLKLIPQTMSGKTLLKRMFLGPLIPVPAELSQTIAPIDEPVAAPTSDATKFRIIYAIARL